MLPRLLVLALAATAAVLIAQQPLPKSGANVTGAYEGWFPNSDGTFSLLFGYYNRNSEQEFDLPIGPANHIDPGGPDRGQPTHFLPRRQWGFFTVTVPKDFGKQKLTWTIVANDKPASIPASLDALWELSPLVDAAQNTPPYIGFTGKGPFVQGPRGQSVTLTASVGKPLDLPLWLADDEHLVPGQARPRTPSVIVTWSKYRGPGDVTFANDRPAAEPATFDAPANTVFHGKAITTATFSAPGEYILHITGNDWTGDGGRGFQCCWTNAQLNVTVR